MKNKSVNVRAAYVRLLWAAKRYFSCYKSACITCDGECQGGIAAAILNAEAALIAANKEALSARPEFNPDQFPDIIFPNWFEREHIADGIGKKISAADFEELKTFLAKGDLYDNDFSWFYDYIKDIWPQFIKWRKAGKGA